jgi:NADH:ubiquinone oxidoreductase subunit F (NADH-binding)
MRGVSFGMVRNGSRGLFWLEPMVEVSTPAGRVAYGPVTIDDVADLFDAGFAEGAQTHPLSLGLTDEIPYLKKQERLTFARMGITDPVSVADYEAHEGYAGLRRALGLKPEEVVQQVLDSGLRGRGGAAFPAGIKWKTVMATPAAQKYIVCNADEGDSGTFSDRMTMEGDPLMLIEGMTIAGIATGATKGYVYIRSEYPHAIATMNEAIRAAEAAGFLGENILGSGQTFWLEVRKGAGSYVCGEETALLESLEGKRGIVRAKPPLPAITGLFGQPTLINNVITLASVPLILARGAAYYRDFGVGRSRGTLPMQLAGNIKHGGLVEKAFGVTLRELLYDYGGGLRLGPADQGGAGGRAARRVPPRIAMGPAAGLRGLRGRRRHGGPRRHRGARRHGRPLQARALCDGVLRHRVVRQVHAMPHRLDARRGGDRQDPRGQQARGARHPAARPVQHHGPRFAVRHGGHDAVPGAFRTRPLSTGLRSRGPRSQGCLNATHRAPHSTQAAGDKNTCSTISKKSTTAPPSANRRAK